MTDQTDEKRAADATPAEEDLSFPRLKSDQAVRLTRTWRLRTFADSTTRLLNVQAKVEAALERAFEEEKKKIRPESSMYAQRVRALGRQMRVRAVVRGGGGQVTRSGELSAIFAEMDLRDIERIEIGNNPGQVNAGVPKVTISFGESEWYEKQVTLDVAGTDRAWVGGVIEEVSAEMARSKPWWSFLRSGWLAAGLGIAIGWGIGGAILHWNVPDPNGGDVLSTVILGLFLGGLFGALVIGGLLHLAFPGFEVHEPGAQPTGRRALTAIVAAIGFGLSVAGVVLGVMAL